MESNLDMLHPPVKTLNYRYLNYVTVVLFAAGLVGAYFLLRSVRIQSKLFWPVFAGLVVPSGMLAGLLVYKCRVGIKKAQLGLSRWALFVSLALLPFHALAWFCGRNIYYLFAPALVVFQLVNLALAAGAFLRQPRFFMMPLVYLLASFLTQIAAMLTVTGL